MSANSKQQLWAISNRLSLRPPQRESVEILDQVCELLPLAKDADAAQALEAIRSAFPSVTDFERDFASLCFALATGVGKTRLMGAFVAYLNQAWGIRHFFVLAPNLPMYSCSRLIRGSRSPRTSALIFEMLKMLMWTPVSPNRSAERIPRPLS